MECCDVSQSELLVSLLWIKFLHNVNPSAMPYDDTIIDRFSSPGAGAISYHNGHHFSAVREISAGEELFCNYGESWLDERSGTFADFVPRKDDYLEASKKFHSIKREIEKNGVLLTDSLLRTLKDIISLTRPRVSAVLPDTVEKYEEIMRRRSNREHPAQILAEIGLHRRTVEWIEDNGICLDSILPGKSKIPHAGRGAIAQRFIPKGSIISPAPLLNVVNRDNLKVLNFTNDGAGEQMEDGDLQPIGDQLLLNYCFGHRESLLLLCPQSGTILMNHCSTRKAGGEGCSELGPNAEIRWASGWDPSTAEWLKKSLQHITYETEAGKRGLSFEVVATRDIALEEEVTIDYGKNWEKAWDAHVKSWIPPIKDEDYVPVRDMINRKDLRTLDELKTKPYPTNVRLICYYYEDETENQEVISEDGGVVEKKMSGVGYRSAVGMEEEKFTAPCEIVERHSTCRYRIMRYFSGTFNCANTYTVRIKKDTSTVLLTDYSEESITFRMNNYMSDMFLPGAFRHFIEIGDDMFPKEWKS